MSIKAIIKKLLGRDVSYVNPTDEILIAVRKLLSNPVNTVFDIGAHHGRFSLAASQLFKNSDTFCFEPSPQSFKILKQNLNTSGFHTHQLALSNVEGTTDFYINEFDETNSLLPSEITKSDIDRLTKQKEKIKVTVSTIDSFSKKQNIASIDLLKIDVQGNTLNTLRGAAELLKEKKIKVIYCEVEFLHIYKNQSLFHEVTAYLKDLQYSLYSLYNIHYDVNGRISWADALYYIPE